MKALLAPMDNLCFPDYRNNRALADDICRFLCPKIINIGNELGIIKASTKEEDKDKDGPEVMENQPTCEFRQLSREDVRSLVQKSAKKTCTLDPIPTSMVVACLEEILLIITCILNSSLGSGHFPLWKGALVAARLKKKFGKDISFSNLRPLSNLQFISKLA